MKVENEKNTNTTNDINDVKKKNKIQIFVLVKMLLPYILIQNHLISVTGMYVLIAIKN